MRKQEEKDQGPDDKDLELLMKQCVEGGGMHAQLSDEVVQRIIETTQPAEMDDKQLNLFWAAVRSGYQDRMYGLMNPLPVSRNWWERLVDCARRMILFNRRFCLLASALLIVVILLSVRWADWYPYELATLAYVEPPPYAIHEVRSPGKIKDDAFDPYYRGLDALLKSQSRFRIFKRVAEAEVDEGIRYLQEAEKRAEAAQNQTYMGECYFYLGKAYLKKKDLVRARNQLEKVRKLSGSSDLLLRMQAEAEDIINALDQLERSRK